MQPIPLLTVFKWFWDISGEEELAIYMIHHVPLHIIEVDQWYLEQTYSLVFRTNGWEVFEMVRGVRFLALSHECMYMWIHKGEKIGMSCVVSGGGAGRMDMYGRL